MKLQTVISTILYFNFMHAAVLAVFNPNSKLIVLSYDGFRADYIDQVETPVLDGLISKGVKASYMRSQFPTKTFPNHQSIVTGLYTESHGIVDNTFFDTFYNRTLSGFIDLNYEFWQFRDDVMPIWILNEMTGEDRISGVQWPGANIPYGPDNKLPVHYLAYDGSRPFEDRMDYVISWMTNETHPANLVFMYFEQPDKEGHNTGPNSDAVKSEIRSMDALTGYLLYRLDEVGLINQTNVIVLSDHGMAEVREENVIPITEIFNFSRVQTYGSSPVLQMVPAEGEEEIIYNDLKKLSEFVPHFSVYKREEAIGKFSYGNNARRIMPLLLVSDPGYVFDYNRRDDEPAISGVHGYDHNDPSMRAFFTAAGPDFKSGAQISSFDNIDVYPLMCNILGLNPAPNNGSLARVQTMLSSYQDQQEPSAGSRFQIGTLGVMISLVILKLN